MTQTLPNIALIYLSYHCEPYLGRFIDALALLQYPKDRVTVIVVDHPHPEYGSSVEAVQRELLSRSQKDLPEVVLLPQTENRGFSGGVNVGIRYALEQDFEFVFLHNQDGFLAPDALRFLVEAARSDRDIGAVQALMRCYPKTDLINSAGNVFHYLGFGYADQGATHHPETAQVHDIGYASGGAVLLRTELLRRYGLWDEDYFLYHEDLEYSLRLRSVGYRVVVAPQAVFFHEYQFNRTARKWYYMERNRWGFLLTYYRWPTLLLLVPIGIIVEAFLVLIAFRQRWFRQKIRASLYWLDVRKWHVWFVKRKKTQLQRVVEDRELLAFASGKLKFSDEASAGLAAKIAERCSEFIFRALVFLVRW